MSSYSKHDCYVTVIYGELGSKNKSPGKDGADKTTEAFRGIAAHNVEIGEHTRDAIEYG